MWDVRGIDGGPYAIYDGDRYVGEVLQAKDVARILRAIGNEEYVKIPRKFDLGKACNGNLVRTRNGCIAKIIRLDTSKPAYCQLIAEVNGQRISYFINGSHSTELFEESEFDLFTD